MNHRKYLKQSKQIIAKYRRAIDKQKINKMQDCRDELSQLYMFYGEEVLANLRAAAELSENRRKEAYNKARMIRREEFGKGRVGEADAQAEIDIKKFLKKENEAHAVYYASKYFMEGIDQVLNAMATRMKYNLRNLAE